MRLAILRSGVTLLLLLMTGLPLRLLALGAAAQLSLLILLWGHATTRRIVVGCNVFGILCGLGVAVQLGWAPTFLGAKTDSFAVLADLAPRTNRLRGNKLNYELLVSDEVGAS